MLLRHSSNKFARRAGRFLTSMMLGGLFLINLAALARAIEPGSLETYDTSNIPGQYIKPIADEGPYSLVVIGDSIGNELWRGLTYSFRGDKFIKIIKKSRVSTGLVRDDYYDWPQALAEILQDNTFHIAVVLFGTNDRQAIRTEDAVYPVGTQEWQKLYRIRVDRIMRQLKSRNIAVYWVGLPVMRSPSFSRHANLVNRIIRQSAAAHRVKFIETWRDFTDDDGGYNAYGTDISGRKTQLRDGDGIHLTMPGSRKLALAVARLIRQDLDGITKNNAGIDENFTILPTLRPKRSAGLDRAFFLAASAD